MTFSWPWALLFALVIPLIFAVRWWALRRRRRAAVRVTSIALVRTAVPGRTRWIRKIPPALFVAGLALLAVGAARPQAEVPVAQRSATILLALDTSGSMCSTDVEPNRLTAAKKAAAEFIESQRGGPRIGLVTFAGTAGLLVPPTDDTDALIKAMDDLTTARGTAIGQAMLASIDAIAEVDPSVAPPPARPRPPATRATRVTPPPRSSCSPTAPTPRASIRRPPPRKRPCGTSASSRSASAPPRRHPWCARTRSSTAVASARGAAGAGAASTAAAMSA
ncbi:VWA domain-containing protein [Nonomuraea salmonea]|uniref:VWA domain-containing protein n=1 Tax=Nonomuraea salmonea TaxID=46181 RepID=UPI002FECEB49